MSFDNNKKTQSTYEEIWATYSKARDRVGFGASKTLSEVLKTAQLLVSSNCGNIEKYYVLFVLMTNGDFEDYKQQWCAFNELSNFPITVLILGIGPGSFAKHQDFIATLKIERKNVLFMDYSGLLRRQPNDDLLVENINTLLKRQICDYYSSKRTTPGDIAMNLQMRKQPSLQTNHQGFSQPNSNLMAQENYPNLSDPMMNPRN
ncbi:hypothetical protein MHBO_001787 [Bonamia ostreae]|uniref:Copine C-terminal domain-containing protein n=1 Tax=Bonamia ostreae TaxID=126728 RepID=A0ABV2AKS5_9EUKA